MMQPEGIEVCSILTKSWNYFKLINESYNHRNVESLELEGTFKGHLVQFSCNEQGHAQLNQVAQGLIQSCLESLKGQDINHISQYSVPVPHHSHCKRLFLYIQPKSTF